MEREEAGQLPFDPETDHAVPVADGPCLGFQLPSEEFTQVAVVMEVLHSRLLHVHPKGPDVEAEDGLPKPGGQLHAVQPAPRTGEQAGWHRLVQGDLERDGGGEGFSRTVCSLREEKVRPAKFHIRSRELGRLVQTGAQILF